MSASAARVLGLIPYSRVGNLVGGGLMAVSMSLFVLNDSIMSSLQKPENVFGVEALALPAIIAVRSTLVVFFLAGLLYINRQPSGWRAALTNRWNLARAVAEASITLLFLSSLPFLPFAIAQTVIASNPIFLVFLGILFFGEQVGWRRWIAIGVGFFGIICAVLALDPGDFTAQNFRWWALPTCLMAACLVAFRDVFTRYVGESVPPITVALTSSIVVTLYGWVFTLLGTWQVPSWHQGIFLLISAVLITGAYLCAVFSVRLGIFAVIGPVRFISLAIAFFLGVTMFQEPFSWIGFGGAFLIVGSAIWIMLRQAHLDKQGDS